MLKDYILVMAVGFLVTKLCFITRKANVQPIFPGVLLPGWPLENGVFFSGIYIYIKFIGFANVPFWQLKLRFGFSRDESY